MRVWEEVSTAAATRLVFKDSQLFGLEVAKQMRAG